MGCRKRLLVGVAVCAALYAGCTGDIGDDPGGGAGSDDEPGDGIDRNPDGTPRDLPPGVDSDDVLEACTELAVPRTPLRRLTHAQYENVVRDLLRADEPLTIELSPDEKVAGFESNTVALLSELQVEEYMGASESIAARVRADLAAHLPCDPEAEPEACAREFVEAFGARAYRRPLRAEEATRLLEVFEVGRGQEGFGRGAELAVEAMIASPHFLYIVEDGEAGADETVESTQYVPLDAYEIASRLSFFLWDSMPDDALFEAARNGDLDAPAGIEREAERLLNDDKAERAVGGFHVQWLDVAEVGDAEKDAWNYPEYDPLVLPSMRRETELFADHVVRGSEGTLGEVLTASYSFVDAKLAALYDVEAPAEPWGRVEHAPAERSGILTHASVMTQHASPDSTSPVLRGKLVRERLLCQTVPPPPPTVNDVPPPPSPDLSTRERFAQHRSDPSCASCHILMDPLGFGFENYDQFGRYRTREGNVDVDASGEISQSEDVDGPFVGAGELSATLAESDQVRACVAQQWFRFAMRRSDQEGDACSLAIARERFGDANYTVRDLMIALTTTDSFRYFPRADGAE